MKRLLAAFILAGTPALWACDPPPVVNCLLLSPECATGESNLRVDVVHLSADVQSVTAAADGHARTTDKVRDGTATFYFFDLPDGKPVKVSVDVYAAHSLRCVMDQIETGSGKSVTVDVTRQDVCVTLDAPDAGSPPDAAAPPDAAEPVMDAGAPQPDGGLCLRDGGSCDDDDGGFWP